VRAEGVAWSDPALLEGQAPEEAGPEPDLRFVRPSRSERRTLAGLRQELSLAPELVRVGPGSADAEAALPRPFRDALDEVERRHRATLRAPLEDWSLDPVRVQYDQLLRDATTPTERSAVGLRLEQLKRQEAASRSARELATLLAESRTRDRKVDALRKRVGDLAAGIKAPFDAEGLMHPSSTMIDGEKAFVLIDDRGRTTAFLVLQSGVVPAADGAVRVGVRGESRYDGRVKSRVIVVRELEILEPGI
jgi:hypothetical protein